MILITVTADKLASMHLHFVIYPVVPSDVELFRGLAFWIGTNIGPEISKDVSSRNYISVVKQRRLFLEPTSRSVCPPFHS